MKMIKIKPLKKLGNDLHPCVGKNQTFSSHGTLASPEPRWGRQGPRPSLQLF